MKGPKHLISDNDRIHWVCEYMSTQDFIIIISAKQIKEDKE